MKERAKDEFRAESQSELSILKISEELTEFEELLGVDKVSPVWGADMSAETYYHHMRPRVEAARRLLLPAELGCALAHIEAYNRIVADGRPALIIEDDICLNSGSLSELDVRISRIADPEFVHFAKYRYEFRKFQVAPGVFIANTARGFWGSAAYYVSPRTAEYLLKWHFDYPHLADNWQEFFIDTRILPYYAPVFEHTGADSKIGNARHDPQNPSLRESLRLRALRRRMTTLSALRHGRNLLQHYLKRHLWG